MLSLLVLMPNVSVISRQAFMTHEAIAKTEGAMK